MRTVASKVAARGAELVLIGNGTPTQGLEFARATDAPFRLLVDIELKGYRAAALERRLLAPYSPRGWLHGLGSWLRGFRPQPTAGDLYQLGGVFLITPEERVEYAFISQSVYDRAPPNAILEALESFAQRRSMGTPVS